MTAGATSPVTFTYDQTATYPLVYAPGASPTLPDSMAVTFVSTGQPYSTSSSSTAPSSVSLYPFPTGYGVIAGKEAIPNAGALCAAEDPAAWGAAPGVKAGTRGSAVGQQPEATSSSVTVPMGVFKVTAPMLSIGSTYVTAVGQSATANGEPGCATTETFTFSGYLLPGATATFALPYGTYQLYAGTLLAQTTSPMSGSDVTIPSSTYNGPLSAVTAGGVLTLDPRPAS